jgi:hypothetical protein
MARTKKSVPIAVLYKQYILASIHLYGVIYVKDLIFLMEFYEQKDIDKNLLIQIIQVLESIESTRLTNYKNEIIGNEFFYFTNKTSLEDAKHILEAKNKYKRYIPSKVEFLRYSNIEYFEPISQTLDLIDFIIKNDLVDVEMYEGIDQDLYEMRCKVLANFSPNEIIADMLSKNYNIKNKKMAEKFIDLVVKILNNTRRYDLLGNTPTEVRNFDFPLNLS